MAVFGILILIVIYLLINAKVSDIEFVEALEEMREAKATLSDSIHQAETERAALFERAVKEIENHRTRELSKQVDANQAQIESFTEDIGSLSSEVEGREADLSKAITERFENHPGVISTRGAVVNKRAEIERIKESVADIRLEAKKTDLITQKTETYMGDLKNQFRVEVDESLAGESVYLVDFGGRAIRTFKISDGEQSNVVSGSAEDLLSAVKADLGEKRVFFFVRPDAVVQFNRALLSFRENDISVGYQPVPQGEKLVLTKFPDDIPTVDEVVVAGGSTDADAAGSKGSGTDSASGSAPAGGSGGEGDADDPKETSSGEATDVTTEGGENESGAEGSSASEQADDRAEGTVDETKPKEDQPFNWQILLWLLLLLIVIFLVARGSRR